MSSATPLPIALAMVTLPARAALTMPGTPRVESLRKTAGIEEVVVDPAIDDVDPLEPARRAEVDDVLVDHEVAALDQLDAHLAREEGVLEVGRVVGARRQHDDARVAGRGRRDAAERRQQRRRVVAHRPDAVLREGERQHAGQRGAVLEHVGDAARRPEIVLEHAVDAVAVAHEVDARHHAARGVRHRDAEGLALEAVGRHHERARHDAVGDRGCLADVEVVEEAVERRHALDEAALDRRPFLGGNDARHQVHRPHPLDARGLAVDREGDAETPEDRVAQALAPAELFGGDRAQAGDQAPVGRANLAVGGRTPRRRILPSDSRRRDRLWD